MYWSIVQSESGLHLATLHVGQVMHASGWMSPWVAWRFFWTEQSQCDEDLKALCIQTPGLGTQKHSTSVLCQGSTAGMEAFHHLKRSTDHPLCALILLERQLDMMDPPEKSFNKCENKRGRRACLLTGMKLQTVLLLARHGDLLSNVTSWCWNNRFVACSNSNRGLWSIAFFFFWPQLQPFCADWIVSPLEWSLQNNSDKLEKTGDCCLLWTCQHKHQMIFLVCWHVLTKIGSTRQMAATNEQLCLAQNSKFLASDWSQKSNSKLGEV